MLTDSDDVFLSLLADKERALFQEEEVLSDKGKLIRGLKGAVAKGRDWLEEAEEQVEFLESEVLRDLKEQLVPTIWRSLLTTFLASGPILWLLFPLSQGEQELPFWQKALALIMMIPITLTWRTYLTSWWKNREVVAQKNRKGWWSVPFFILTLFLGLGSYVFLDWLIQTVFLPEGWLFYEVSHLLIKVVMFAVIALAYLLLDKWVKFSPWSAPSWFPLAISLVGLASSLAVIESAWVVTPDSIQNLNLFRDNKVYAYQDVERVEAKFGSKIVTLDETVKKGEFSYRIWLDGKEIIFMTPSVNHDLIAEDSYFELEEFDKALMALGINKTSSEEFAAFNSLDAYYTDRFVRIIRNQPTAQSR